jgi:hypothetical protein
MLCPYSLIILGGRVGRSIDKLLEHPTQVCFSDAFGIAGANLDSFGTLDRFPSTDSDSKEYWRMTKNSKTDIVVVVVVIVVVAIRRTAILRIVDPRAAAQFG